MKNLNHLSQEELMTMIEYSFTLEDIEMLRLSKIKDQIDNSYKLFYLP